MEVGSKGNGKHWTKAEVEARQEAEKGIGRKGRYSMRVPEWLSEEARKIWRRVLRENREMEGINNLSADMLAIYCDALVKYHEASGHLVIMDEDGEPIANDEAIKAVQAWARLIASYADKLGFTPVGQARLVKRKADEILDSFGEAFDG